MTPASPQDGGPEAAWRGLVGAEMASQSAWDAVDRFAGPGVDMGACELPLQTGGRGHAAAYRGLIASVNRRN